MPPKVNSANGGGTLLLGIFLSILFLMFQILYNNHTFSIKERFLKITKIIIFTANMYEGFILSFACLILFHLLSTPMNQKLFDNSPIYPDEEIKVQRVQLLASG
jgi:hypothetical protein